MKVSELIKLLSTFSPDAKVIVIDENADYAGVYVTRESVTTNGKYVHITVAITEQDVN